MSKSKSAYQVSVLFIAFLLCIGCATSSKPEPVQSTPLRCPLELRASLLPEPKPGPDALLDEASRAWLANEYQPWALKNVRRLERAREWCLNQAQ